MGIPSVIVVPSCGDVIVDLDSAASDGFEYGAANEGFHEEDGAGMWQQAGERICEECVVAKSHKTKLHITDCQSCHQSIPEHNIMGRRKPQVLRGKKPVGKKKGYQWEFSDDEDGDDEPKRQDDDDDEDEEEAEEEEVEQVKPRGKGMSGRCRVSDQTSYSQLSREEGTMISSHGSSTEIDRLNEELADTKRKLEMALICCNQITEKDMSREFKEYDLQLSGIVRNVLLRYWKFFEEGMEQWSDDKDSVCQIVLSKIQMPPGSTVDDEKKLWTGFLAMRLSRKFTVNRNKIVQDMRQTFVREYSIVEFEDIL